MQKTERKMPLSTSALDDLFSTQEQRDSVDLEKVVDISLKDIADFPNQSPKLLQSIF